MTIGRHLSIINLNVNGLNVPTQRTVEWIKKQVPSICCPQETHFRLTHRMKVKG